MRFGICGPSVSESPAWAAAAESLGFDQYWLFDSHMVYADVYVTMALCAQQTSRRRGSLRSRPPRSPR
jgi:alkanesulfonate monooxygenase SsuD/methylene tetrahydromethanopterin reductase-like flavin-dependent oxidoreductase (luciferase family)